MPGILHLLEITFPLLARLIVNITLPFFAPGLSGIRYFIAVHEPKAMPVYLYELNKKSRYLRIIQDLCIHVQVNPSFVFRLFGLLNRQLDGAKRCL
ncbi:MAG: hypothetical protein SFV22_13805 [Saprospiraceae bacterium]|nr:hypothetical protein [Saprospiraceae bacterium]